MIDYKDERLTWLLTQTADRPAHARFLCKWPLIDYDDWQLKLPSVKDALGYWIVWRYEGGEYMEGGIRFCQTHLRARIEQALLLSLVGGKI